MMKNFALYANCAILLLLCLANQLPAQNKIFLASAHSTWADTIDHQSSLYFTSLRSRTQLWSAFSSVEKLEDYENSLNSPRWVKIRRVDAIWYFPEFALNRDRLSQISVRRGDALITFSKDSFDDIELDRNLVTPATPSTAPVTLYVDIPINKGYRASWPHDERPPLDPEKIWNRNSAKALTVGNFKNVPDKSFALYSRALESGIGDVLVWSRSGYSDGLTRKVVVPTASFQVRGVRNPSVILNEFQPTSQFRAGDSLVLTRLDDLTIFELQSDASPFSQSGSQLGKDENDKKRLFHCELGRNEKRIKH